MAHMIDETTGQAAIAYAGATPWHALGRKMGDAERRDLDKAMQLAGLQWLVDSVKLTYEPRGTQPSAWNTDAQKQLRTWDRMKRLREKGRGYVPQHPREKGRWRRGE